DLVPVAERPRPARAAAMEDGGGHLDWRFPSLGAAPMAGHAPSWQHRASAQGHVDRARRRGDDDLPRHAEVDDPLEAVALPGLSQSAPGPFPRLPSPGCCTWALRTSFLAALEMSNQSGQAALFSGLQEGALVLADISGYSTFVAQTEV